MSNRIGGYAAPPLSRRDLVSRADWIRRVVGVSPKEMFPIVKFVEKVLYDVFDDYSFEVLPEKRMGDNHGCTIPSERTIQIREDVYLRACEGCGRDRFTMAHEAGHLLLLDGKSLSHARSDTEVVTYRDPEWQADAFAGALLMPAEMITQMNAVEVAVIYGVSDQAASYQKDAIERMRKGVKYDPNAMRKRT